MNTRFGVHHPTDYGWLPPEGNAAFCEDLLRHGVSAYLLWADGTKLVDLCRALVEHGITVVYRPGVTRIPDTYRVEIHQAYLDAGAKYQQFYNEGNLFREWRSETPKPSPERFADLWHDRCWQAKNQGFIPVIPPLSPGGNIYHREFFTRMMNRWRDQGVIQSLLQGCVLGIHNRPMMHPPDLDHDHAFNEYKWYRQKMREYVGYEMPMIATEAGYEPDWVGWDWQRWMEWNLELIRRFRPSHPQYVGDSFLFHIFWLYHDQVGHPTYMHCGLVRNWHYEQVYGTQTTNLWDALAQEDWEDSGDPVDPDPEPDPPPPPPPYKIVAFDKSGASIPPEQLLAKYNVHIQPCEGAGFRVVELRERCEAANCDVWALNEFEQPLPYHNVRWGWPGTEISQLTDPHGRVGFAMSPDAYYDPEHGGGPHWTAVAGNSELVKGIGMIASTVHCTLNFVFQWMEATPAPEPPPEPPDPPPPPEPPEPGPDVPYSLKRRLEMAPHGFENLLEEIEAISDMETLEREARRDEDGNPLFHLVQYIVLHNSGYDQEHTAMSTARQAIKEGEPTIEYHFCIGGGEQDGLLSWTARLVHKTNHIYGFNDISVGVCILGDYEHHEPSQAQLETARFVIAALYEFLGQGWGEFRLVGLIPHRDARGNSTACPGMAWPLVMWSGPWPKLTPPVGL